MKDRLRALVRFRRDERAATAIEYALMAAVLSIAILGSVSVLGHSVRETLFSGVVNGLADAAQD